MELWIVYGWAAWDGCSEPIAVFDLEKSANQYADVLNRGDFNPLDYNPDEFQVKKLVLNLWDRGNGKITDHFYNTFYVHPQEYDVIRFFEFESVKRNIETTTKRIWLR